ncbi:MAG: 1-(5-phosphoribosyl)-5-[(5-phosphoribosylamino)methylideneamino]imidazole-4-carboxamide isomerase [Cytophagales bacterium]|nr:MAG: 1-(5-phosphoribosyl)-5-[(5-phosphoribosylamino)methylideneamino]imidazole-4-carboxamide isomerase [Cytophagales bacterium]TAF59296.1 MAG: 1-(5-phosphoribosyl)-5-[(5-phosphoribosylamino)methylideneamino]imidazole-4-carboxamide isomerase [Cytophagales bacterium]
MTYSPTQPIPALDLINGQCVRLYQGDYAQKTVYKTSPLDLALSYEAAGLKRLHLVDLDGAKAGEPVHLYILEQIASKTSLIIDFGGGIRTKDQAQSVLDAGAAQITVGSLAVKAPETFADWLTHFGSEKILLAADVRNGFLAVSGWTEQTQISIFDAMNKWLMAGLRWCFCTDISHDGTFAGPALSLYKELLSRFPSLRLIASGGVRSVQDLADCEALGMSGVIIGKALLEEKITLKDLSTWQNRK